MKCNSDHCVSLKCEPCDGDEACNDHHMNTNFEHVELNMTARNVIYSE